MGWKQIGAIAESGQEFPEYHLLLQDHLQQSGISVVVKRNIVRNTDTLDVSQVIILCFVIKLINCSQYHYDQCKPLTNEPRHEKICLRGLQPG